MKFLYPFFKKHPAQAGCFLCINKLPRNEEIKLRKLKIALFLAILVSSTNIFAQINLPASNQSESSLRSLSPIIDSIYDWQWDTLNLVWKVTGKKMNILYDINNNQTGNIHQSWNGSTWKDSIRATYSYDASNNMTTETYENWNGSTWVSSYQINYTYDANNNKTSYISLNGPNLTLSYKVTWNYDINNNIISKLEQNWNGSAWVNLNKNTLSYDANHNQISEVYQSWSAGNWMDLYQYSFTYDINNNLTSRTQQNWNGSAWVNAYKATFSYDVNKNITNSVFDDWNGAVWVNSSQYTYTYNANNNKTNEIALSWNGGILTNYHTQSWAYDANNFLKNETYKSWNTAMTEITSGDSSAYYYHTVVGINDLVDREVKITLFPNPSSGKFTIKSNHPIYAIEINNVLGEQLYSNFNVSQPTLNEIDIVGNDKGVYFIKIDSGGEIKTHKIVIQ